MAKEESTAGLASISSMDWVERAMSPDLASGASPGLGSLTSADMRASGQGIGPKMAHRSAMMASGKWHTAENMLRLLKLSIAIVALLLSVFSLGWWLRVAVVTGPVRMCVHHGVQHAFADFSESSLPIARVLATAPGAIWLLMSGASRYLQLMGWLAVTMWVESIFRFLFDFCVCRDWGRDHLLTIGILGIALLSIAGNVVMLFVAIVKTILALERGALMDFGGRFLWKLRYSFLLFIIFVALSLAHLVWGQPPITALFAFCWLVFALGVGFVTGILVWAKVLTHNAAKAARKHATPFRAKRAKKVAVKMRLLTGSGLFAAMTLLMFVASHLIGSTPEALERRVPGSSLEDFHQIFYNWTVFLFGAGVSLLASVVSGAFSGAAQASLARANVERRRQQRWREAAIKTRRQLKVNRMGSPEFADWQAKVQELAGRGISLDSLMTFYRKLGTEKVMPNYKPAEHTTKDVVKAAVLPLTATAGVACAELMMEGVPTIPNKMVTHNWSNIFRDLVASIAADALGDADFSVVACLLEHDVDTLASWISKRGSGSQTYWVCAFSVNQHLSICPEGCPCGQTKKLNQTPPLLGDGRSIPCEMNKFDNMMSYLSTKNPEFSQIVAVDAKFNLFSRAWCIAEIAAANQAGMLQELKITSADALEKHAESLRGLRVQDMQSSRPEDKQQILDSIEDHDRFNEVLQKLLFDELIPSWSSLDGGEHMALVGSLLRMHDVALRLKDPGLWTCGA